MKQGFFKVLGREDFLELVAQFPPLGTETIGLEDALGRVLAKDVVSPEDLPLADRSCMDGYAVRAADIFGAGDANPAYLERCGDVLVNEFPEFRVDPGNCARIPTGGCLPQGADGVVMVEHAQEMEAGTVEVRKSLAPGENVMFKGEDVAQGEVALSAGTKLRVPDVGLLAALGVAEFEASLRPRVGILSTGDEVLPVDSPPEPGKVRDVNSYSVGCMVKAAGCSTNFYGIVPDRLDDLLEVLKKALAENDVVFLSGGSSVGTRDLTIQAIESLPESEILAHGVGISPGKPTILARVDGKAVMGLPGQIASAQVVMLVLGMPLIRSLCSDSKAFDSLYRPSRRAVLARNLASKQGREDYVRVSLEQGDDDLPLAHPVLGKSGLMRTLVRSCGLVVVPEASEGLYKGNEVDVWLI